MTTNELLLSTCNAMTTVERDLLGTAMDGARQVFAEDGHVNAILLMVKDNEFNMIPIAGMIKQDVNAFLTLTSQSHPVVMVGECWITHLRPDKHPQLVKALQENEAEAVIIEPQNNPNRLEGVVARLMHKGRTIVAEALIDRKPDQKPTLAEWRVIDGDRTGGLRPVSFGRDSEQGYLK